MKNVLKMNYFLICLLLFTVGQALVWFQLNGQFISEWFKNNTLILSLLGVPISYIYIYATKYGVESFGGLMWPQRFIGFSIGIIIFALMSYFIMKEGLNLKTILSLTLSFFIILVQILL
jgi:hypothetical protein